MFWKDRPLLIAKDRPPYEICVDRLGERGIAKDEESIDLKERALMKADGLTLLHGLRRSGGRDVRKHHRRLVEG